MALQALQVPQCCSWVHRTFATNGLQDKGWCGEKQQLRASVEQRILKENRERRKGHEEAKDSQMRRLLS
eukprot:5490637-Amphidinium_carterae.1